MGVKYTSGVGFSTKAKPNKKKAKPNKKEAIRIYDSSLVRKACSLGRFLLAQSKGVVFPEGEPIQLIPIREWENIHQSLGLLLEPCLVDEHALAIFSYVILLDEREEPDEVLSISRQAWDDARNEVPSLKDFFNRMVKLVYQARL